MTRTIERIMRTAMLAVAFMLCATSAWAAEPVAEWTDFRNLTSGDYTWTVDSSCTIDPNTGVLTIGKSGGLYISLSGFGEDDKTLTIAIDAEIPTTFADDRTIVDILLNGNNRVSVAVNGTTMGQCWNDGAVSDTSYGKDTFPSGRQLFIVKYKGGTGTTTCYNKNQYIANNNSLHVGSGKVWLLGVGCYNSANPNSSISEVAEGMKIYSIRLYGSRISEADVTADYDNYYPANSYLTLSGTNASWSTAEWNNTSTPKSASYITVTENTSLNVDAAVSVGKVFFNVANGKALTLTGASSITASSGIYINNGDVSDGAIAGGTIAVANEGVLSGDIKVQGDAGITISGNSDSAGTVSIDVAEGKTLNLSASALTSADTINLTGSGAVVPQTTISAKVDIGAGVTVSANSGETIRVSNFKGAGTIIFDGVLPSNVAAATSTVTASATDSSNWTGTLWLKNYNTAQASSPLYMSYWVNANSKIKFTNVSGYLPGISGNTKQLGYDGSELGEWVLEDEIQNGVTKYAFTKTDGYSDYWIRFKKLSGTGTMAEKNDKEQTPKVRIADGSEFTGTLKLDKGMRVAFSDSDVSINAKQIVIASGEEVTANSAWTTSGFVVDGTLNLNATPSGKVVGGSGTVNLGSLSVANGISEFASAAAWTGKVVVPAFTASGDTGIAFNSLGNANSTVVLKGITAIENSTYRQVYFDGYATGAFINPTVQIDGDVNFTFADETLATTFSRVTGNGNLYFDAAYDDTSYKFAINEVANFNGEIGAYSNSTYGVSTEVSIGTLALSGDANPSVSERLVKIRSGDWSNIVRVENTVVTIGGNATEYKLVKKNVGTATAGLYLAPAAIKASDGTLTPYESVDAAFTALSSLANDAYDYMAVYESATVTFTGFYKTPKIKTVGEGVVLTINSGYGDYGWIAGSPSDGVVTYSVGPISADYTWVGAENAYWSLPASWSCGGVAANRAVDAIDNVIFSSDASVTIQADVSVASISNSAAVTFAAASAKTITVGDGGVVMTALGNSITLSNVTLSKTPTTTAATLAVKTTGGGEDPTVYTVVNAVASVDGVGYATMAEASEALKTGSIMTLQQNYDGTVTIYPGKYLVQKGYTVTSVVGADTDGNADDGIVVTRNGNSVANYYWQCVDQRTATWSGTGAAWSSPSCWAENFAPTAYTAVTIPATEGHATAITLSGDVTIKSLALGAGETLTLSRSGDTALTLTTSQAIVLTSGQSIITNPGVTISPAITTEDANSYVKSVISEGATTYTVAAHKATVYDSEDAEVKKFDSVVDAFAAATDGQKITLFANSSDAITLSDKSITFNEGSFTFTGSFTGNGTVRLTSTLKSAATARWAAGWTGTVVLPANLTLNGLNFDNYGRTGSTVQLQGTNTGWLQYRSNNDAIATTVEIPQGASLTVTGWSVSFANAFDVLKGAGTFAVSLGSAPDASGSSSYTAYFLLKDVSAFTGSLTATGAGIAIGDTRIANTVAGGKIIVSAGKTPTIASGATWQAAGGFTVDGSLTCSKGGKIYGTGAAGTLALGGSGVITNRYEGGSSQCFNAGTITVSDSLSVVMVGGWSNFGTTWSPQNSSSIGFDPGTDNDIWLNSTIPNNSNANCTLCIYGNGSNKVVWNSNSITPWAKIHVYNGGKLQIGTATGTNDYLGYASIGALGAVTVDAGGELYFYTRETYTRHTYLNGGTITFAGDHSSRSFDIFRGPTVYVTDDSVMQATGSSHWVYLRDTAPTFNVDANKTLTFNASFTYAGESNKDLIKVGAGTMVVNGYVDGSGNHESFSQPKGVDIRSGTYELNTVQTSNGQTGANANFYTVAAGAKLKIGATGQANMTTLSLVDGSLLEFGAGDKTLINATTAVLASGNATVSFSVGVSPTSGTQLIGWTTGPGGNISFANGSNYVSIDDDYYCLKAQNNGLYVYDAVALFDGVAYDSIAEAITVAGDARLADIGVLDVNAAVPEGYLISDGNVVKAQAAIVDTEGTAHYYATAQAAANEVDSYLGVGTQKTYDYFAVYFGTDVEMSVNLGASAWNEFHVKVKCLDGATVSVVPNSEEYAFSAGEPDENNVVTYTKIDNATSYFWAGATSAEAEASAKNWGRPNNWKIGSSSGAVASRAPSSIDTANIPEGAYVTGISVADSLTITGGGTITATSGISLTAAGATISVTGVTLSPKPTTTVSRSRVVEVTDGEGRTTYSVEVIPGTTFTVY